MQDLHNFKPVRTALGLDFKVFGNDKFNAEQEARIEDKTKTTDGMTINAILVDGKPVQCFVTDESQNLKNYECQMDIKDINEFFGQ
jgi:hypothetical protein